MPADSFANWDSQVPCNAQLCSPRNDGRLVPVGSPAGPLNPRSWRSLSVLSPQVPDTVEMARACGLTLRQAMCEDVVPRGLCLVLLISLAPLAVLLSAET